MNHQKLSSRSLLAVGAVILIAVVCALGAALGAPTAPGADMLFADHLPMIGMAGMLINKENLSAMFTGYKTSFNEGFRGVTPSWAKVATLVPSTAKDEKYGWLGQFPRLREWIGDRQVKGLALHDYSIKNKKFESSIGVSRDDIDDDSYGVLSPLFQEMGFAAATHPDELVFAMLAAGFTSTCYDGQYFFDTDHPVGAGTASNHGGGSGNAWFLLDTRRPLKPLIFQKRRDYALKAMTEEKDEGVFMRDEYRYGVDARVNSGFAFWQLAYGSKDTLDATKFDAAVAAMQGFKSDEGRPLGINPSLLVVGPSNRAAGKTLIEAEYLAGGANNTNYKAVELLVCPWLT